jgi:hypothetical protein
MFLEPVFLKIDSGLQRRRVPVSLRTITTHRFGRSESRATTPRDTPPRNCFSPSVINADAFTKKVSVDEHGVRGESMGRN